MKHYICMTFTIGLIFLKPIMADAACENEIRYWDNLVRMVNENQSIVRMCIRGETPPQLYFSNPSGCAFDSPDRNEIIKYYDYYIAFYTILSVQAEDAIRKCLARSLDGEGGDSTSGSSGGSTGGYASGTGGSTSGGSCYNSYQQGWACDDPYAGHSNEE